MGRKEDKGATSKKKKKIFLGQNIFFFGGKGRSEVFIMQISYSSSRDEEGPHGR